MADGIPRGHEGLIPHRNDSNAQPTTVSCEPASNNMEMGEMHEHNDETNPEALPPKRKFRVLKKILLVLALLVIAFLVVVAMRPDEFRIVRSAAVRAPAPVVFAQVNDFHNWQAWSPWAKRDPNATAIFEGPSAGEGAIFRWAGNPEVGEGSMTITESRPHDLIRIRLEFLKPFKDTSLTEFTFEPKGDETFVTWTMTGRNNFISKVIQLFLDMEQMVGGDFEMGLRQLKTTAEESVINERDSE